jgi:hypothetical protein
LFDTTVNKLYGGDGTTTGGFLIGNGDVSGPSSAVANRVVFFDGTSGKLIKDSGLTLSGTNTGDQTITLTGDVTGSGTGSFAATISASSVTLAKMANLAANSIIGNNTVSAATPIALSGTQVTAMLDVFSSTLKGLTPASGGGTTNFLRADGTWASPSSGSGTVTSITATSPLLGGTITTSGSIGIQAASAFQGGYLTANDWSSMLKITSSLYSGSLSRAGNNARIGTNNLSSQKDLTITVYDEDAIKITTDVSQGPTNIDIAPGYAAGLTSTNFQYNGQNFLNLLGTATGYGPSISMFASNGTDSSFLFMSNSIALSSNGDIILEVSGAYNIDLSASKIRYVDSNTGYYIGFQLPTLTGSSTYTLPTSVPTSNKVLQSDSSGVLTWVTSSGGGTTTNALTMNNSGSGAASGSTFDGSTAVTLSYNTIGASPLAGSTSLTTLGTVTTGTLSTGAVIGGVTMTLGSDASYDVYYRGSSGVLTRLANGTTGQFLGANTGAAPSWQTPSGGGSMSIGGTVTGSTSGSILFINSSGQLAQDNANLFFDATNDRIGIAQSAPSSRLHINFNQNSVTQSDANGILLANSTAAIAGTQSISPAIVWQGNGWKTTATAGSQDVRFRADVLPVQGTTNPTATWQLASSVNGAAYTNLLTYTSAGVLSTSSTNALTTTATDSVIITANSTASTGVGYGINLNFKGKVSTSNDQLFGYIQSYIRFFGSLPSTWGTGYNFVVYNNGSLVTPLNVTGNLGGEVVATNLSAGTNGYISTNSSSHATQIIGGLNNSNNPALTYKTTNAGGTITSQGVFGLTTNTAGNITIRPHDTNGLVFTAGNGSAHIARAAIQIVSLTNTAGAETGDLAFYTQTGGTAIAERMRIFANGNVAIGTTSNAGYKLDVAGQTRLQQDVTISDTRNFIFSTSTGTKFGNATGQKLSFWNKTPIAQPTTAITAATFVANTSLIANDTATYGGYTIGQIAAALINMGILA